MHPAIESGREWTREKLYWTYRNTQRTLSLYLRSLPLMRAHRDTFRDLEQFVLFLGYPMSGHTQVGNILDGHREMSIAHELNVLQLHRNHFSRQQILTLLMDSSFRFTREGKIWGDYSYAMDGQYQGRYETLRAIGDKRGGNTTRELRRHPQLLPRLAEKLGLPIKVIHIVRNPFDNITIRAKKRYGVDLPNEHQLAQEVDAHVADIAAVDMVLNLYRNSDRISFHTCKHEDLIRDPKGHLAQLCHFIGLSADEDFLQAVASMVFDSPKRRRFDIKWPPAMIRALEAELQRYPFARDYTFAE